LELWMQVREKKEEKKRILDAKRYCDFLKDKGSDNALFFGKQILVHLFMRLFLSSIRQSQLSL